MLKRQVLSVIEALLTYLSLCHAQWLNIPQGQVIHRRPVLQRQGQSAQNSQLQTPQQESKPSRSEETHSKTLSAPSQRCQVEEYHRIPCGEPDATDAECEAIDCCFDGHKCFYGLAVTLQCTGDGQFVVVVARDATLPPLSLDSISLAEVSGACGPVDTTSAFAIYQFPVSSCGTTMKEEDGHIVYENIMSSSYEVGVGSQGSITRDSSYELLFQCRYSSSAVKAIVVEVNALPPPPSISLAGPIRVELRLANGICTTKGCTDEDVYSSYYTEQEYPVTKVLQEPVHVEVRILERTDPDIVLLLDHCWATSSPDSTSLPQWDLLFDGCPYTEDRYLTTVVPVDVSSGLLYPTHHKRFVVKMFTFVKQESLLPLQQMVFIHCSTSVCSSANGHSCRQSCNRKRRALHNVKDSPDQVVSSGEVIIIEDWPAFVNASQLNGPVSSRTEGLPDVSSLMSYALLGVIAMTICGLCGLVAVLHSRRRRSRLQTARVCSDMEQ
ncbi:zona pellucida glycoprotein 2, like 2 [Sardina pilchardus]|uniref:zona pellucida glycoprotein 2, like 2 n=1 Tax=Sardina pilchardus TaxID=27697 RepID=UPI002E0FFD32